MIAAVSFTRISSFANVRGPSLLVGEFPIHSSNPTETFELKHSNLGPKQTDWTSFNIFQYKFKGVQRWPLKYILQLFAFKKENLNQHHSNMWPNLFNMLISTQPRSQGLSSSLPLERQGTGKRETPGTRLDFNYVERCWMEKLNRFVWDLGKHSTSKAVSLFWLIFAKFQTFSENMLAWPQAYFGRKSAHNALCFKLIYQNFRDVIIHSSMINNGVLHARRWFGPSFNNRGISVLIHLIHNRVNKQGC